MKCNKCNQKSIKIENGHILCDICGLDIDVSWNLDDELPDLFIFNLDLKEAEDQGHMCYFGGELLSSNLHSLNSDSIALNKSWERGWCEAERECEFEGLSFSAKKLNEELIKTNDELIKTNKDKEVFLREASNYYNKLQEIEDMVNILYDKKYILGKSYRKDVALIKKKFQTVEKLL